MRVRLAHLDGLRALAALYVVAFHVGGFVDAATPAVRGAKRLLAFGHDAVAVFIVLSGYCLMLPVARAGDGALAGGTRGYLARRARRILPAYYAALALSLGLIAAVPELRAPTGTLWDDSNPAFTPGSVLSHLLLVHNVLPQWTYRINGPLWSVATEWQIYFFFPLLLLPVWRRAGAPGALAVGLPLGYLVRLLAPAASATAIPWYLGGFTLGMVAAGIGFSQRPLERALRDRVPWGKVAAVLGALCAAAGLIGAKVWFRHQPVTDALVALTTASLLVHCASPAASAQAAVLRLLGSSPLVAVGRFSYSLYLTHLPVLALCFVPLRSLQLGPEAMLCAMLVLGFPVSVACAYGFFLAVEKPLLRSPAEGVERATGVVTAP